MASLLSSNKTTNQKKSVSSFSASYAKDIVVQLLERGYFDSCDPQKRDEVIKNSIEDYALKFEEIMN